MCGQLVEALLEYTDADAAIVREDKLVRRMESAGWAKLNGEQTEVGRECERRRWSSMRKTW